MQATAGYVIYSRVVETKNTKTQAKLEAAREKKSQVITKIIKS